MSTEQLQKSKSLEENIAKTPFSYLRISKIELSNFKGVKHGEIALNRGEQSFSGGPQSDILGIYGQNGSGKTSVIEALSILRMAMSGKEVPPLYSDCISINQKKPVSTLKFTFDFQFSEVEKRVVEYELSLKKVELSEEEIKEKWEKTHEGGKSSDNFDIIDERLKYRIQLFDETVKQLRVINGKKTRLETIITTSGNNDPFGPRSRMQEVIKNNTEKKIELKLVRKNISKQSKSFIFCDDAIKVINDYARQHEHQGYLETLLFLKDFAEHRLFVIDTKDSGVVNMNIALPIFTKNGLFFSGLYESRIKEKTFSRREKDFANISIVLSQLIPGLSIRIKRLSKTIMPDGEPGFLVVPMAHRGDIEIPLRDESDGVRKIISVISLIIAAYNDSSTTIAIDELDAGIFEYILGEILQSFEEDGRGQFIFTSHNLRPLEVLSKKFIVFTTTNSEKRYARFKDLSSTNNLRASYYREIMSGGQETPLYDETKRYKIKAAMRKAFEEK